MCWSITNKREESIKKKKKKKILFETENDQIILESETNKSNFLTISIILKKIDCIIL